MNGLRQMMMRKVRGVRVVDLGAGAMLLLIVLVVYASKTSGGAEAAKIADTDRQIATEEQQVRLLRAQESYLTRPERLRTLSRQYLNMAPVSALHEVTPESLLQVRQAFAPAQKPVTPAEAPR